MKAHWDDYPNTGKEMLMWHLKFWAITIGVLLMIRGLYAL